MDKKIDLELNKKFRLSDFMNEPDFLYKGHKIIPQGGDSEEVRFSIRNSGGIGVAFNIKTLDACRKIIDNAIVKAKGFKKFMAYHQTSSYRMKYRKISVNSLSKDGDEFNCTFIQEDDRHGYAGERMTIKKHHALYKDNSRNGITVAKINEKIQVISLIEAEISKLSQQMEKDDTLKNFFKVIDADNSNG